MTNTVVVGAAKGLHARKVCEITIAYKANINSLTDLPGVDSGKSMDGFARGSRWLPSSTLTFLDNMLLHPAPGKSAVEQAVVSINMQLPPASKRKTPPRECRSTQRFQNLSSHYIDKISMSVERAPDCGAGISHSRSVARSSRWSRHGNTKHPTCR